MAKDMSKGEKLDMILSELSALKSEVKKLTKQQDALTNSKARQSRPTAARVLKKPAKKSIAAVQANSPIDTSKRPTPVEATTQPKARVT